MREFKSLMAVLLKAVMNQNGFIVGPTGGSAGASTGKVVMNEIGVIAGYVELNDAGLFNPMSRNLD